MTAYVDTSALYALLDQADPAHERAASVWREFCSTGEDLVTSNYVLLETSALIILFDAEHREWVASAVLGFLDPDAETPPEWRARLYL